MSFDTISCCSSSKSYFFVKIVFAILQHRCYFLVRAQRKNVSVPTSCRIVRAQRDCSFMLLFFCLHVISLVWLTRVLKVQQLIRYGRHSAMGKKTEKRLQRCAPRILERMNHQQQDLMKCVDLVYRGWAHACIGKVFVCSARYFCNFVQSDKCALSLVELRWNVDAVFSLQVCMLAVSFYCRWNDLHCARRVSCQLLSSVFYMISLWRLPSRFSLGILLGVLLPIFPPLDSTAVANPDSRTQPFGNAGASCYINATLQALFGLASIRQLCDDVVSKLSSRDRNTLLQFDYRRSSRNSLVYVREDGPLDGDVLLA